MTQILQASIVRWTSVRVAVYYNNGDVRLEERPKPEIGSRELLVQVMACGICGSDVMEWYRIRRAPIVLGHEITGEVVGVGYEVKGYKGGERVFVSHHVPCNTCHYCLSGHHTTCDTLRKTNFIPGGFAEYVGIPEINVDRGTYVLPKEVSYEEGVSIEPLACVVRGQRLAGLKPGQSVLIIGSGVTGILHIQLACAQGAGQLIATDINDYRLKAAKEFGANAIIHASEDVPTRLREENKGRLADQVIICTAAQSAIAQGLKSVERGGTVLFFAPTEAGVTTPVNIWDPVSYTHLTLPTNREV